MTLQPQIKQWNAEGNYFEHRMRCVWEFFFCFCFFKHAGKSKTSQNVSLQRVCVHTVQRRLWWWWDESSPAADRGSQSRSSDSDGGRQCAQHTSHLKHTIKHNIFLNWPLISKSLFSFNTLKFSGSFTGWHNGPVGTATTHNYLFCVVLHLWTVLTLQLSFSVLRKKKKIFFFLLYFCRQRLILLLQETVNLWLLLFRTFWQVGVITVIFQRCFCQRL